MFGHRHYPVGAEASPNGAHFRVWAPGRRQVEVVLEGGERQQLESEQNGYFSGALDSARIDSNYRFRLDGEGVFPDPASRFQPDGPHGPSQVIDPTSFKWTDQQWGGRQLDELVVYEMHIGTFTPAGTWEAAARELPELAELGINCLEVMPVAEFPGKFGWGYDGVNLFAPSHLYGTPDDFRRFVDVAHSHGIAVLLDVVYNHLGPDGNYLDQFSPAYFTDRYQTDWGAAINFDGQQSTAVREFFLANVSYWIQEFHLDGLRLDATQNIYDDAPQDRHILTQIGERARAAAPHRTILIIAENEPQLPQLCRPIADGGNGLDAVWNDDYHHSAMVALTGRREAYYTDYLGSPQEFISAAKYGYLYQGQWYSWQKQRRGRTGLDLPPAAYMNFIQNHDQVANSGRGLRAHQLSGPGRYRAISVLTLLMPGTPMLFQGQEFAASTPFFYFADHGTELANMVEAGRIEFLSQFPSLVDPTIQAQFAKPHEQQTFMQCKLDFTERKTHSAAYQMTRDVLQLRRTDAAFRPGSNRIDGAVIAPHAFVLRYFVDGTADRLLVVNLGPDLDLSVVPEPLLAPPAHASWRVLFSTEDPRYGGHGIHQLESDDAGWTIPGESATVLGGERPELDADLRNARHPS